MSFDPIGLISLFIGILTIVNGWILVVIKNLQAHDGSMSAKLIALEVLVASSYLTRNEFQATMTTQTASIIKAIEKSESKVEKVEDRFVRLEAVIASKQDR